MEIYSRIGYEQSCVDVRDLSHMVWGPTFLYLPACWETGTGSGTDWYLKLSHSISDPQGNTCRGYSSWYTVLAPCLEVLLPVILSLFPFALGVLLHIGKYSKLKHIPLSRKK